MSVKKRAFKNLAVHAFPVRQSMRTTIDEAKKSYAQNQYPSMNEEYSEIYSKLFPFLKASNGVKDSE